MNADMLVGLLKGTVTARQLESDTRDEVDRWHELLKKRGSSAPITLTPPSGEITVSWLGAVRLLDLTISGELRSESLTYVIDALLLSQDVRWEDDRIRTCFEKLSDSDGDKILTSEILSSRISLAARTRGNRDSDEF